MNTVFGVGNGVTLIGSLYRELGYDNLVIHIKIIYMKYIYSNFGKYTLGSLKVVNNNGYIMYSVPVC